MTPIAASPTRIVTMSRSEFLATFGAPDLTGALCGYTREDDTRIVLTLLCHSQPRRVLEVGTAAGHMAANLTRWSPDDATVFTLDLVRGMPRAAPGAAQQQVEVPTHADWGRFVNHFGTAHKAFFITADTMTYDFGRLEPIDFAFIDGSHEFGHVWNDSRKTYEALVPGGWMVWHDFNSPVPWVKVSEAIERLGFAESVVHVEETEVAFLRKGGTECGKWSGGAEFGGRGRCAPEGAARSGADAFSKAGEDAERLRPPPHPPFGHALPAGARGGEPRQPVSDRLCVAWEGDFDELHSLALVNRAICRELVERGHDVRLIAGSERPVAELGEVGDPKVAFRSAKVVDPPLAGPRFPGAKGNDGECYSRGTKGDDETANFRGAEDDDGDGCLRGAKGNYEEGDFRGAKGDTQIHAQMHVRHQWPPRLEAPAYGRWVLMQPWEYGSLPRAWLPMLRRVDEVWAYSRYVRDCYLEAEVPRERVHVIPLGVDPARFRPGLEPMTLPDGPEIRFLFVGGTIFRKGINVLLKAFARAFRPGDGIGLVVKEMGSKSFYRGQTAEAQIAELRERGYPVEYIDRDLDEADLARLYSACDCLVHPFRGEGFALPVVEAMACGLPVIVTGAGPALDYATGETALLIPAQRGHFSECRVGDIETIGRPWLFEPDADVLVELLKRVAGSRAEARAKGMAASAHVRENFTWARTADAIERRLLALAGLDVGQAFQPDTRRQSPDSGKPGHVRPGSAGGGLTYNKPYPPVRLRTRSEDRPKVSLTMIVRNEEKNLPCCLRSIGGLFDEIVVVDTGSQDRTREIAREFGARVFDFVWIDNFAAARNAGLAQAMGDYAFWLDADDVIDPHQRANLERLIASLRAGEQAAYVVKCACDPGPDGAGGDTVVDHIRLFPLRDDVRWTYRVHEQILPALRKAGVPVRWTDVTVRHTGYTDRALRAKKLDRGAAILRDELAARPDDPFVLFNLGSIVIERQDWGQALDHLRHSLAGSAPTDSITRKLYALIARSHQMLGEPQQALAACAAGLGADPDDAELLFREAIVRRHIGDNDGAGRCWRHILTLKRPEQFSSVDQGIYGHLTRRNLAALARERGNHDEAKRLWRSVLDECPNDREARSHLGE